MNYYTPRFFTIGELVCPTTYKERGQKAFQLFDPRVLYAADVLRDQFGACIINNWKSGGDFKWSGLRTPMSPHYSHYSQHSFGRALDMKFRKVNAQTVRDWIVEVEPFSFPVCLEDGVNWVHLDVRQRPPEEPLVKLFKV